MVMKQDIFVKEIKKLYNCDKVYGPYKPGKDGRRRVSIKVNGKLITKQYAKFKLEIILGRILDKDETVDHIDGNKLNDSSDNLRLLSRRDNVISYKNSNGYNHPKMSKNRKNLQSKKFSGEGNFNSKLTNSIVLKIRSKKNTASERMAYAKQYGVSYRTIVNAEKGISFKNL